MHVCMYAYILDAWGDLWPAHPGIPKAQNLKYYAYGNICIVVFITDLQKRVALLIVI